MNSEGENGRVRFNASYQGFVFIFYWCCCGGCCCCVCALAGRKKKKTLAKVMWAEEVGGRETEREEGREGLRIGGKGRENKANGKKGAK